MKSLIVQTLCLYTLVATRALDDIRGIIIDGGSGDTEIIQPNSDTPIEHEPSDLYPHRNGSQVCLLLYETVLVSFARLFATVVTFTLSAAPMDQL